MNDFMNNYFGPLSSESCLYFYIVSVICGFSFALVLISTLLYIITNYNKVNRTYVINAIMGSVNLFLAYFVNRLLHTMCVRSLL